MTNEELKAKYDEIRTENKKLKAKCKRLEKNLDTSESLRKSQVEYTQRLAKRINDIKHAAYEMRRAEKIFVDLVSNTTTNHHNN